MAKRRIAKLSKLSEITDILNDYVEPVRRLTNKDLKFDAKINYTSLRELLFRTETKRYTDFLRSEGNQLAVRIKETLDYNMKAKQWPWPAFSSTYGDTRDIVDKGNLLAKNFCKIDYKVRGFNVVFGNRDTKYGPAVHYGAYIRPYGNPNARLVYLPGRPWITTSVKVPNVVGRGLGQQLAVITPNKPAVIDISAEMREIYAKALRRAWLNELA